MNDLLILAIGFITGTLLTFFIVNGKRHKERLENQKLMEDQKAAAEVRLNNEIEQVKQRLSKVCEQDSNKKLESLAGDLLPVIDAMHMAIGLKTDNVTSVKDGVHMICDRLENVLQRHGCSSIHPKPGDPFDPEIHQAVACHGAPEEILDVKRVGFRVGDKILRAAAVEVGQRHEIFEGTPVKAREEERVPAY